VRECTHIFGITVLRTSLVAVDEGMKVVELEEKSGFAGFLVRREEQEKK
jgi:hypothetical protein